MALTLINVGSSANDGTGDPIRTAFQLCNVAFAAVDARALLTANTFTGAQVVSVNGAVSAPALSLTGTIYSGGSATTTKPHQLIEPSGTTSTGWSTGGTAFGVNVPSFTAVTTQASIASTFMPADWQEAGSRLMALTKMTFGGISNAPTLLGGGLYQTSLSLVGSNGLAYFRRLDDGWLMAMGSGFMVVPSAARIGFSDQATNYNVPTGTSSVDAFFKRKTAGSIQLGVDSATPVAQTFSACSGSGTNIVGAKLSLAPGQSTGNATPAVLALQGTAAIASGTTAQTLVDVLTIFNAEEVHLADGVQIHTGSTTGTTIAASSSQKLGFWGAAAVAQPAHIGDPTGDAGTGTDTVDLNTLNTTLGDLQTAVININAMFATTGLTAAA